MADRPLKGASLNALISFSGRMAYRSLKGASLNALISFSGRMLERHEYCQSRPLQGTDGGEEGIRTPDTVSGIPDFESGAFSHSATSPAIACAGHAS